MQADESTEVLEIQDIGDVAKFFFCLPMALPLADATRITDQIGDGPRYGAHDDPWVTIEVHQIKVVGGQLSAMQEALYRATRSDQAEKSSAIGVEVNYTVLEATTPLASPDPVPQDLSDHPEMWTPRSDALTRCLRFADDLVRGYRLATQRPILRPLYPTIGNPLLMFRAPAEQIRTRSVSGIESQATRVKSAWDGPSLIWLDQSLALRDGTPLEPLIAGEMQEVFDGRMLSLREGDRRLSWLERLIEAKEAIELRGQGSQSVVLTVTSVEVLVSTLLTMLAWEEGLDPLAAADVYDEGRLIPTILRELAPRLKGNWSTSQASFGVWHDSAYRLRHRVVHGGYEPSAREAKIAIDSTDAFATWIFDRLADRRNDYPKTTLMTLAPSGLIKRDLWRGRIKKYFDEVASTDERWVPKFVAYDDAVLSIRAAAL